MVMSFLSQEVCKHTWTVHIYDRRDIRGYVELVILYLFRFINHLPPSPLREYDESFVISAQENALINTILHTNSGIFQRPFMDGGIK